MELGRWIVHLSESNRYSLAGTWNTSNPSAFGGSISSTFTVVTWDKVQVEGSQAMPSGDQVVTAATAAKSLQSCPTLCDPIDGSPPGSPVPGILQTRTLEWVAVSFSNIAIQVIWILDHALNWPLWACFYLNAFNAVIGIHPNLQSLSLTSFL